MKAVKLSKPTKPGKTSSNSLKPAKTRWNPLVTSQQASNPPKNAISFKEIRFLRGKHSRRRLTMSNTWAPFSTCSLATCSASWIEGEIESEFNYNHFFKFLIDSFQLLIELDEKKTLLRLSLLLQHDFVAQQHHNQVVNYVIKRQSLAAQQHHNQVVSYVIKRQSLAAGYRRR